MKTRFFMALVVMDLLVSCASTPKPSNPYWGNPQWVNALGHTIQANIRYPEEVIKNTPTTGEFPYGKAIVQFTYDKGQLTSVQIMRSTGYEVLDKAIASEIPDIKPPLAEGQSALLPHRFELAINMGPFDYGFFDAIHSELQHNTYYPRSAILRGDQGLVVAGFHYLNGRVINPLIIKSSGSSELDRSVLRELDNITLQKPPHWLQDKTLDLSVSFCFSLRHSTCAGMVLEIRYVPTSTANTPSTAPCSEVGFKYQDGRISNVHLIDSSGNPDLDKQALAAAAAGKLLPPSAGRRNDISNYESPVCNNIGPDATPANAMIR